MNSRAGLFSTPKEDAHHMFYKGGGGRGERCGRWLVFPGWIDRLGFQVGHEVSRAQVLLEVWK